MPRRGSTCRRTEGPELWIRPTEMRYEVRISGASVNGNEGRADIVYYHDGVVEIYEIKPGSYAPGAKNNADGKAQLDRYIQHLKGATEGVSLNPIIEVTMIESNIHPDRMIRYYTYPVSDPGMIYWGYVKIPRDDLMKKKEKSEEKSRDNIISKEIFESDEQVAIAAVALLFALVVIAAAATGGAGAAVVCAL